MNKLPYKPKNGKDKGKSKGPAIFVEVFPVPTCSVDEKQKIMALIKKLPENLGREHQEPDKKILNWLKKLTDFQRTFFFQEAAKMPEEKLMEALKKIVTADDAAAVAKKNGLFPQTHFEQELPETARFKPLLIIKQLWEQARPDQKERFKKLEEWWEKASDAVKDALIFKLAPLKSADAVGIIKSLVLLNDEQKENYLNKGENNG
jgi:hypothetical protein